MKWTLDSIGRRKTNSTKDRLGENQIGRLTAIQLNSSGCFRIVSGHTNVESPAGTLVVGVRFFEFNTEFLDLFHDFVTVVSNIDLGLNVSNFPVFANINRGSFRAISGSQDPIGFGNFAVRVAKEWIVEVEFLSKLFVLFNRVTTGTKISNVVLAQLVATLTE